jgi:hypothetical protein
MPSLWAWRVSCRVGSRPSTSRVAALQVNINAGRLPEPESNGERYLKIPLNALQNAAWDE